MNTNSSKIRLKKRCVLTGRASGIVGPFNISRIKLRDILGYGLIPGVQKSSW
jgi:small subunit ribosomal protein S14